jgi:hypothetical protein
MVNVRRLRNMPEDELMRQHDELMEHRAEHYNVFLDELTRREAVRQGGEDGGVAQEPQPPDLGHRRSHYSRCASDRADTDPRWLACYLVATSLDTRRSLQTDGVSHR